MSYHDISLNYHIRFLDYFAIWRQYLFETEVWKKLKITLLIKLFQTRKKNFCGEIFFLRGEAGKFCFIDANSY
jgi:hypothetical protein